MAQNGAQTHCSANDLHREDAEKLFSKPLLIDQAAAPGTPEGSSGGSSEVDDTVPLDDAGGSGFTWKYSSEYSRGRIY